MEYGILDLHRNFIENQKQQIENAKKLIEYANGNEEIIRLANEFIKSCKKSISIEQNINNAMHVMHCPECKSNFHFADSDIIEDVWVMCPDCKNKICILE